jgi:hypothetical protein
MHSHLSISIDLRKTFSACDRLRDEHELERQAGQATAHPSSSFLGLAENPKGFSFRNVFRSSVSLCLARPDITAACSLRCSNFGTGLCVRSTTDHRVATTCIHARPRASSSLCEELSTCATGFDRKRACPHAGTPVPVWRPVRLLMAIPRDPCRQVAAPGVHINTDKMLLGCLALPSLKVSAKRLKQLTEAVEARDGRQPATAHAGAVERILVPCTCL